MKTSRFQIIALVACIGIISIISCKHKAETFVVPTYPLAGTWKGTTWQNRPVTITIAHVDTGMFITSYDISVKNDSSTSTDTLHLTRKSDNGIAPILKDSTFSVPIAHIDANFEYINGKFNFINMTVSGSIKVIFPPKPDIMKGAFTAAKQE